MAVTMSAIFPAKDKIPVKFKILSSGIKSGSLKIDGTVTHSPKSGWKYLVASTITTPVSKRF